MSMGGGGGRCFWGWWSQVLLLSAEGNHDNPVSGNHQGNNTANK